MLKEDFNAGEITMNWKDIIKDDEIPRYLQRDADYVTEEEYLQRAGHLFDKKNIGRIYRNKVNGINYIFERLMGNGDIVLRSAPDEITGPSEKEKLQMSLDSLKVFSDKDIKNNPTLERIIRMTEKLMEQASDEKPKTKGEIHTLPPDLALNYDLLPEQ